MRSRVLLGVAAGLTALTVGAGIASAQSDDDTGTDDTVVEQPTTTDNSTTDNSTPDNSDSTTPPDDSTSRGDRAGCDHGAADQGEQGGAPSNPTAPDDSSS
jgi:hypothetical protein